MWFFEFLAERRIREAIENGDMNGLPGSGQPLVFADEPFVSPEQRMVNHILKRAGLVPSDVSMRRAIADLCEEIRRIPQDDAQAESKRRELAYLLLKTDEERLQS